MMKRLGTRITKVFGPALLVVACGSGPTSPRGPSEGSYGILFIGNSLTYTNALPEMVRRLLGASPLGPVDVVSYAFPNYGLEDHWANPLTRQAIAAGGWRVVVLQQGPSATEGRPSLLDYSQRFAPEIRAVGAEPALYMVWPDESSSFDFDGVSESYTLAAQLVNGLLFPAGEAWRAAWRRDPTLALYGPDGFHPSELGSYLAALVMYQQLSGLDAANLPPSTPRDLGLFSAPEEVVRLLHAAAAEASAAFAGAVR